MNFFAIFLGILKLDSGKVGSNEEKIFALFQPAPTGFDLK